ncbi:BTAD domain-containing putative transcriptional regulator [Micromonospora sp. NPDC049230]|uniref:AfsR/SARP family transcriptional regulator n=1 Tax=Micromonospora sp. NPDC049230 TaxID=3155502 RepID=UPI0033ED3AEC
MDPGVRFSVLGPVRVWRAGIELDPRPPQLRHVLGLLLVRAGSPVAPEEFARLLWGDDQPARAANIVHRHIGLLRRLLEPGLGPREQGQYVQRVGAGYSLDVEASAVDLIAFRRLAERGHAAAGAGDPATALAHLTAALQLWRARCAADLDTGPEMAPEFVAVDHERTEVAGAAVEAALSCGQPAELLPLIRTAANQDPLDEALHARLILLLVAAGRQAAAMAAFEAIRVRLHDELGVEPGPELRAAQQRMLGAVAGPTVPATVVAEPVLSQLPPGNRHFSGRAAELARLSSLAAKLGDNPAATVIGVVDGLPGMGKTSLVVQWAHESASSFPDGRVFLDLRGFDDRASLLSTEQALDHLLLALGVAHTEIPPLVEARKAMFRTLMADRRMLLILDNARDEEHVRPLIPTSAGSLVLVTSRNRMLGLISQEGAVPLNLDRPSPAEYRTAFRNRLGADRIVGQEAALDEIVERCGGLPLAVAVVCARAVAYPDWSLRQIADELRDARSLDFFDGEDPRSDVRTVFSWSYHMLSDHAARLFRLLTVGPGPDFGLAVAAAVAGLSRPATRALLRELVRIRLLTEYRPGRFRFDDLIRTYAAELSAGLDGRDDRDGALRRLLDQLWQTGYAAGRMLSPAVSLSTPPPPLPGVVPEQITDPRSATAWFADELALLEAASTVRDVKGFRPWQLAQTIMPYYQRRAMTQRWRGAAGQALDASMAAGDLEGVAVMHRLRACAEIFGLPVDGPNFEVAWEHLNEALRLFDAAGSPSGKGLVHTNIGRLQHLQGRYGEALRSYERALTLFESAGHDRGAALALIGIGAEHGRAGDIESGFRDLRRGEAIALGIGDVGLAGCFSAAMAGIEAGRGRFGAAITFFQQARDRFGRGGNVTLIALNEESFGDVLAAAGRHAEAASAWRTARQSYADLGQEGHADRVRTRGVGGTTDCLVDT